MKPDFDTLGAPGSAVTASGGSTTEFVITVDEMSERLLGVVKTVVRVQQYRPTLLIKSVVNYVLVPGVDDFNFRASFSWETQFDDLVALLQDWLERTNYIYVNVHALEDYCRYLGCYDIDWN